MNMKLTKLIVMAAVIVALLTVVGSTALAQTQECGECKGKVTQLTLKYNGTTAALVEVVQKKNNDTVFSGVVQPGEEFPVNGTDNGTLGTEISVYVNGQLNTKIHTSCSQPIGPGMVFGDFEVIEGYSKDGGLLCPVPPDPDPGCGECKGKITQLTLQYNGVADADVRVEQKNGDTVFPTTTLSTGDNFTFNGTDNGTFGTEIKIFMNDDLNTKIHTSCSKPIGPGMIFGDFEVIAGESKDGGLLCPVDACSATGAGQLEFHGKEVKWDITNNGDVDIEISRITINWPTGDNGFLNEIKLDHDKIYDQDEHVSPAIIDSDWVGDAKKRTIKDGDTDTLKFKFQHDATAQGRYIIEVVFAQEGCSVAFDSNAVIGDRVWWDENKDQVQDSDEVLGIPREPGFDGVTVELYSDIGTPGVCDATDTAGTLLHSTPTGSGTSQSPTGFTDGVYGFDMTALGLGTGGYCVYADASTLPTPAPNSHWEPTTANPQYVNFTGSDDFSIDFGFTAEAGATFIQLGYFQATPVPGGVRFEWQTATELLNAGFNLYAAGASGRVKLNEELIPSKVISSLEPTDYEYTAYGVSGDRFWIEDVEVTGQTRLHGPFDLGEAHGSRSQPQATAPTAGKARGGEARSAEGLKGAGVTPQGGKKGGGGKSTPAMSYKIFVNQDGIYRLTYEYLRDQGADLSDVKGQKIALLNRGQPVPIYVTATGKQKFGPGHYIEFVGQALDTLYTGTNVYWLTVDRKKAARVAVVDGTPGGGTAPEYFMETVKVEENNHYFWAVPGDAPWFADYLHRGADPVSKDFSFSLTDLVAGEPDATLAIVVSTVTDSPEPLDHHVTAAVNGNVVLDAMFGGSGSQRLEATFSASDLREGLNILTLSLPTTLGTPSDLIVLDYFTVTFPRRPVARGDTLRYTVEDAGADQQVEGFASDQVVVYRVAGQNVTRIEDYQTSPDSSTFTVRFNGGGVGRATFMLAAAESLLEPVRVEQDTSSDIKQGAADYLIISHANFIGDIRPLADYHASRLVVKVVDVADVYDEFNDGIFDASAVDAYIAYAQQHLGVRYVLLVGDDTADYHNYSGQGSISFIPSLYAQQEHYGLYPSDSLYADTDGDGAPDLAIGRLPVKTSAEVAAIVEKTTGFQGSAQIYSHRATFVADNDSPSFENMSEALAALLPEGTEVTRAYLDGADAATVRSTLFNSLEQGSLLINYSGHGGVYQWASEQLLATSDVAGLGNVGQPTMVMQWNCLTSRYSYPYGDSLSESLITADNRGAVLTLGSVNVTETAGQEVLARAVYGYLFQEGLSVGEAVQRAKVDTLRANAGYRDVVLGWMTLGDPALELP